MEESEKRRERLRAMRMEAASQASSPSPSPSSHLPSAPPSLPPAPHLFNPLTQPPQAAGEASPLTPRFDFYTNPMATFAGSKRKNDSGGGGRGGGVVGGGGGRGGYYQQESFSSPILPPPPMSLHHSPAGSMNYHMASPSHQFQVNQSHEPNQNIPQSDSRRIPGPFASPFSVPGPTPAMNPAGWNRSGGSSGHSFPPTSSRGGFGSPGSGRGANPGRGNIWQSGGSSSPGRTGGRGRGFNEHGSSYHGAGHFQIKAMVEDPWRELKPIVGSILVPRGGPGFWLPNSLLVKKPRVEGSANELSSQNAKASNSKNEYSSHGSLAECLVHGSLAECLAQAFDEAVDEANT